MGADPQLDYDALLARRSWLIRRVEIDNTGAGLRLTVTAGAADPAVRAEATLQFTGVVQLEFRQEWDELPLGLQIADMADYGWEDVRWQVSDPSYGIASFHCADFTVDA